MDITSTGRTLRENNLQVIDEIALCTARLIANQVSYKLKYQEIWLRYPLLTRVL
ncbi:hypothetical protein [Candidatus Hakubella thermalkaliphila]|uniref:hypothetical protein n=1 Tax=Candidatus Hakubella thermalkaliphila TaxID=2754717 RepID=UPI002158AE82